MGGAAGSEGGPWKRSQEPRGGKGERRGQRQLQTEQGVRVGVCRQAGKEAVQ